MIQQMFVSHPATQNKVPRENEPGTHTVLEQQRASPPLNTIVSYFNYKPTSPLHRVVLLSAFASKRLCQPASCFFITHAANVICGGGGGRENIKSKPTLERSLRMYVCKRARGAWNNFICDVFQVAVAAQKGTCVRIDFAAAAVVFNLRVHYLTSFERPIKLIIFHNGSSVINQLGAFTNFFETAAALSFRF